MAQYLRTELDGNIEYVSRIRAQYSSLSKKHRQIANYIFKHQQEVIHYSISTLAKKTNTAPSTITRFCQILSFKGFSELKVYIEKGLISASIVDAPIQEADTTSVILQKLMKSAQDVITDTLRVLSVETVSAVAKAIFQAPNVNLFGQSGGYISALYAQQILLRVGIRSQAFNDNVDMSIAASTMRKGDVAIGFGYSGESRSVIHALQNAKDSGATIVTITATPNSTLEKLADYTLLYSYNIPDDLQYLHLGSICEVAILGVLQAEILHQPGAKARLDMVKDAVLSSRIR